MEIKLDHKELRKRFNDFFFAREDTLVERYKVKGQKLKGGKVKNARKILESQLGVNKMYVEVLGQILQEQIDDLLFLEGQRLVDFEDKEKPEALLVAHFYYSPDLVMTGDIDYTCENPVRQSEEDAWADRCKELQHKHKYNEAYTEESLDVEGLEVLIDLIVSDDRYTLRRKWIELAHLPKSLQTEIKAHKAGDLFETKYQAHTLQGLSPEGEDPKDITELDAHVKIYDVRRLIRPDIDDDLAVKEKFESLEQLKAQFQVDFDEYTERARKGVAYNHIVNQVVAASKIPQLPDSMVDREMRAQLAEHLERCHKDEQLAMKVVGASNRKDMEKQFRHRVIQEIVAGLAAKKYAKIHGMPVKEELLVDHMTNEIEWVEKKEETDE